MKKNDSLSIVAFILAILAICIASLKIDFSPSTDTFIGIMAGLIGACATIIVGFQIYNSIEYRNKIQDLEKMQLSLKEELINVLTERKRSELIMNGQIERAKGLSLFKEQPFSAYKSFHKELEFFLKANIGDNINTAINDLRVQKNKIIKREKSTISKKDMNDVANFNYDLLKNYELSALIKERYDIIYNEIKIYINEIPKNEK